MLLSKLLLSKLQSSSIPYTTGQLQTAVAVILSESGVTLIQRKHSPLDIHSGQIAFPGGRVEPGENSLMTAIRETYEEIGITLTNENHLGRMNANYFLYFRHGQAVYLSAHIFRAPSEMNFKLSELEVQQVLHLDFGEISMNNMKVGSTRHAPLHALARTEYRQQYLAKHKMQGFRCFRYPYLNLQSRQFYGLSWLIMCHLLKQAQINQDVTDFTFKNCYFEFDNPEYSRFYSEWYGKKRLNQFLS